MISRGLLSEILGIEVIEIKGMLSHENNRSTLSYIIGSKLNDSKGIINIYELAHKCKEWAYINEYNIASYKTKQAWIARDPSESNPYEGADTEPEAIFKACQWILEQEQKNR